jgi:hypothetical protein
VGNTANIKFGKAFGSSIGSPNYVAAFDYTGGGTIGNVANIQFGRRFGSVWTNL